MKTTHNNLAYIYEDWSPSDQARLEDKICYEPTSGCWLWVGSNSHGYGRFYIDSKMHQAYHVTLALAGRPVPAGLVVDHLCRNPWCVNPDHLAIVTERENLYRSFWGTNSGHRGTMCKRGHLFTESNIIRYPSGEKECRKCKYKRENDRYHRVTKPRNIEARKKGAEHGE